MHTDSVFVSYRHESTEHVQWVENLAARLENDTSLEFILDRWDLRPGDDVAAYTEHKVEESRWIVVICTPEYKNRFDSREGGVGYEGTVLTASLIAGANRRIVPVLRRGDWRSAAPSILAGKRYVDLRGDDWNWGDEYDALVDVLTGVSSRRPRSEPPVFEGPARTTLTRRDPRFWGRGRELEALSQALNGLRSPGQCVLVRGPRLVGKTALLRQFVSERASALFPDGIAWLDGRTIGKEVVRTAKRYGLHGRGPVPPEVALDYLERALRNRRVLIIVDGLDPDLGGVRWLPRVGEKSRVAVISSVSLVSHAIPAESVYVIDVEPWQRSETALFLSRRLPDRVGESADDLVGIAGFVAGLPLGAQLLCALAGMDRRRSTAELLNDLKRRLATIGSDDPEARLEAVFLEVLARLPAKERRVLVALSACGGHNRTEVVARVAGLDPTDTDRTLERMHGMSLLEWIPGAPAPWTIHDPLQRRLKREDDERSSWRAYRTWVFEQAERFMSTEDPRLFAATLVDFLRAGRRLADEGFAAEATALFRPLADPILHGADPEVLVSVGVRVLAAMAPDAADATWWADVLARATPTF